MSCSFHVRGVSVNTAYVLFLYTCKELRVHSHLSQVKWVCTCDPDYISVHVSALYSESIPLSRYFRVLVYSADNTVRHQSALSVTRHSAFRRNSNDTTLGGFIGFIGIIVYTTRSCSSGQGVRNKGKEST